MSDEKIASVYPTVGKMVFKGFRGGSSSFHGVEKSILVSALQKCIRGKQVKEAQWAAMELVLFDQVADNKAKAILTNVANRLEIISCEDVSESSWPVILYVDNLLSKWTGNTEPDKKTNDDIIMKCCIAMAHEHTKMLRFPSLARAAWWTVVHYRQHVPARFQHYLPKSDWTSVLSTKPSNRSVLDHALEIVRQQPIHDQIYYWAYELVHHMDDETWQLAPNQSIGLTQVHTIVPNKKKIPQVWALWNQLLVMSNVGNSTLWKLIRILFKWFQKKRAEQFIFLFKAIRLTQVAHQINWSHNMFEQLLIDVESTPICDRISHKSSPPVEMPKKAYDMHTLGGKTDYERFAKEGAAVGNKDQTFDVDSYERVYLALKQAQDKMGKTMVRQLNDKKVAGQSSGDQMKQQSSGKPVSASKSPRKRKAVAAAECDNICEQSWFTSHVDEKNEWMNADMSSHVNNYIHAQRVTSNWKQHVLMTDQWIFKGPFDVTQSNVVARLKRMTERWIIFQTIGFRMPRFYFLKEKPASESSSIARVWIQFEAMHTVPSSKWKLIPKRDSDAYPVVDRASTEVFTGVDFMEWQLNQRPKIILDLLIAMISRYIMQPAVGDSGLWNILVRVSDGWVVPIDMEEVRGGCEMSIETIQPDGSNDAMTPNDAMTQLSHVLCARGLGPASRLQAFQSVVRSDDMHCRIQQLQAVVDGHREWFSDTRWKQIQGLVKVIRK